MGLSPREVDQLSVFQYLAALDGYIAANSPEGDKSLTEQEKDELWQWLQSGD